MSVKRLIQSRKNLSKTYDRQMWQEGQIEVLPFRYRLHYNDGGTRNVKAGRLGLIAEIRESRPIRIERIKC